MRSPETLLLQARLLITRTEDLQAGGALTPDRCIDASCQFAILFAELELSLKEAARPAAPRREAPLSEMLEAVLRGVVQAYEPYMALFPTLGRMPGEIGAGAPAPGGARIYGRFGVIDGGASDPRRDRRPRRLVRPVGPSLRQARGLPGGPRHGAPGEQVRPHRLFGGPGLRRPRPDRLRVGAVMQLLRPLRRWLQFLALVHGPKRPAEIIRPWRIEP